MTTNRKTYFFFDKAADFAAAKEFLLHINAKFRASYTGGAANGRLRLAWIEIAPSIAFKNHLDLYFSYFQMISKFSIPDKFKKPLLFEANNVRINEKTLFVEVGDYYATGAAAKHAIGLIKKYMKQGISIEEAANEFYFYWTGVM